MSVPMKKLRTERFETVTIGNEKFRVRKEKARALLVLLSDPDEETISADEVFRELDAKYTRPGVCLRGSRAKEEMSQAELARRLGISQSDLSKMELGKRPIGKKMAIRLGKILNVGYKVFL